VAARAEAGPLAGESADNDPAAILAEGGGRGGIGAAGRPGTIAGLGRIALRLG
jgi:hypothetical protein